MNRKDYLVLAALVGMLFLWPAIDRKYFHKKGHVPPAPVATETNAAAETAEAVVAPAVDAVAAVPVEIAPAEPQIKLPPEQTAVMKNDRLAITLSSRGASIKSATLFKYRSHNTPDSGPVEMDFTNRPALSWEGIAGVTTNSDFALRVDPSGRVATFLRREGDWTFSRVIELDDNYGLQVRDEWKNGSPAVLMIPETSLRLGTMAHDKGHVEASAIGTYFLSVDSLSPGGEKVQYWGSSISDLFEEEMESKALPRTPVTVERAPREREVDWVAAKNKYFVQILTPAEGADGMTIFVKRDVPLREVQEPGYDPGVTSPAEVSAAIVFQPTTVAAGQSLVRASQLYVGPKDYAQLHARRLHQVDVMEFRMGGIFGWMDPVVKPCAKLLLVTMNWIHDHLWPHNYGLAIILLTIIVRTVFWPVTHKSTVNMKRMAALQPQMTAVREKHKDNPQRMQQEMMALYKENKINPLGGCLPMLIQIPVFMALFLVLRSGIELRFAPFLWIRDLSEPENLFAGVLPIALNILPLFMAFTMYWQQRLTPTAGDPAQAKMMRIMMPGMMLVFLYNFASGLALYWSTQNVLMIIQQLVMQRGKKEVKS